MNDCYIIQLNQYLFYTGRLYAPMGNINRAKHYKNNHRAAADAAKIFTKHKYIKQVEILKIVEKEV